MSFDVNASDAATSTSTALGRHNNATHQHNLLICYELHYHFSKIDRGVGKCHCSYRLQPFAATKCKPRKYCQVLPGRPEKIIRMVMPSVPEADLAPQGGCQAKTFAIAILQPLQQETVQLQNPTATTSRQLRPMSLVLIAFPFRQ
mmetsp:Transcript_15786/g.34169  ORF Transcript_15786/g.34169 Transcript_15786/m.34169 type:complete len:145 (+) Transcript_15786:125-559(+)